MVRRIASQKTLLGSQLDLLVILLQTMQVTCRVHSDIQTEAADSGVFERLIESLSWPNQLKALDEIQPFESEEVQAQMVFQIQALQTLQALCQNNPQNLNHFQAFGGWENVTQVILWCTEYFSINPGLREQAHAAETNNSSAGDAREEAETGKTAEAEFGYLSHHGFVSESSEPLPPPPGVSREVCRELEGIFDALTQFFIYPNTALFIGASKTNLEEIVRRVLLVVLNVFDDTDHPSAAKIRVCEKLPKYPELHFFVIQLLSKMVQVSGEFIEVIKSLKFYEILFSRKFFWATPSHFEEDVNLKLLPQHISRSDAKCVAVMTAHVRSQSLSLIAYIATLPDRDNAEELKLLLSLLQQHKEQANIVVQISLSLIKILQHNLERTQRALQKLNPLPLLSQIIKLQRSTAVSMREEALQKSKNFFTRARFSILSLLGHFLVNNESTILFTLGDHVIIAELFALLMEEEMRKFTLDQVISLMKVVSNKNYSEHVLHVYRSYLRLLTKVSDQFHFNVSLLGGLRQVLQLNTHSQRLLR